MAFSLVLVIETVMTELAGVLLLELMVTTKI